jgi:uncharacterized protein
MKLPVICLPIIACSLLILGAGCLGIGKGDVQPTLFYTLEPVDLPKLAKSPEEDRLVVGLERIAMPDYLNRREIAVRTGRNELRYTERHLWAERPSDALQRLLSLNIERQSSVPVEMHSLPWPDHAEPKWVIYLDVQAFEGRESPEAELLLNASWTIRSTSGSDRGVEGNYEGQALSWSKGDYAGLAGGLSAELINLGRLVAKDLEEFAKK